MFFHFHTFIVISSLNISIEELLQNRDILCIIWEYMNDSGNSKNIGADKIVLLGLFILSLLTAKLIVTFKSRLIFSDPIELADTGLSISIPTGNGWTGQKQWRNENNISTLNSIFTIDPDRPSAWVYCEYLPNYEFSSSRIWFEQKAAIINGTILEIDSIEKENLTIDWTHIEKPEVFLEIFLATIKLENNQRLNIEVHESADGIEQAKLFFLEV